MATDNVFDIELLLRHSARWLLHDPDRDVFLCRMAEAGPLLHSDLLTDDPADVQRSPGTRMLRVDAPHFFRSLGWAVLSAMPLPSQAWQPQKLPLPGRNDPCLCGSLRRFKHCCGPLMATLPRLDPTMLASIVLQEMPATAWRTLPASRVPPLALTAAAHDLREAGRARDALRLLEPWSRLPAPWPAARADMLDLLADLYLDLGHPRKRRALADAMVQRGDVVVQSLGWQRLSMMAADVGDGAASRAAFERAQRLTPDDPRIALLEVTTLMGAGDTGRAHERAAFHARRLSRLPQAADLAHEVASLEAIARGEMDHLAASGGPDAMAFEGLSDTVFDELATWVSALPPARLRLDLARASAEDLGELKPAASLRPALKGWREIFGRQSPAMAWAAPDPDDALQVLDVARWRPLLAARPALLDSFEVLDDLVGALDVVPMGLAAGLQAALLTRALDLWTLLRGRYPAARCEWGWLDNRPALRLLVRRVEIDASPRADGSLEWLRALVEVLNPHDNHGLRDRLAAVLLRHGDAAAALALAERYPDDFVGLQLLHARALLALQRLDEAERIFDAALPSNPHVLKLLRRVRAPRLPDVASYRVGSPEQARVVVANQHDLWRDPALQAWLKAREAGPEQAGDAGGPVQLTLT